jgi:hypothetical protein
VEYKNDVSNGGIGNVAQISRQHHGLAGNVVPCSSQCEVKQPTTLTTRWRIVHVQNASMSRRRDVKVEKLRASEQVDIIIGRDNVINSSEQLNC